MVAVHKFKLIKNEETGHYHAKTEEKSYCPICGCELTPVGSCKRGVLNSICEKIILILRILMCKPCEKYHRELPDILVPYKRYSAECVENILTPQDAVPTDDTALPAADDSTIARWKVWFNGRLCCFIGCMAAIAKQLGIEIEPPDENCTPVGQLIHYVGGGVGWLKKVVRNVVNTNNWQHYRSA